MEFAGSAVGKSRVPRSASESSDLDMLTCCILRSLEYNDMSDNSRSATLKVRAEVFSLTSSLVSQCERNVLGEGRVHSPDLHEAFKDLFLKVRLYGKVIMSRLDIRW